MSSNCPQNEEQPSEITMLNIVNQFDQRRKTISERVNTFTRFELDSMNIFRNMMMFQNQNQNRLNKGIQLSFPLSSNADVDDYLIGYDSEKLTQVASYVSAIAQPPILNRFSSGKCDVSMNRSDNEINTDQNYFLEANSSDNKILLINASREKQQLQLDEDVGDIHSNVNKSDNFLSNINQVTNNEHQSDNDDGDDQFYIDSQQQLNNQDIDEIDDEDYSCDSDVNWLYSEEGNDSNDDIQLRHLNTSLEVPSNSLNNAANQMNDTGVVQVGSINSIRPINIELGEGDETETDESWQKYESDLNNQEPLVPINVATKGTTNDQEPSENVLLNGSISIPSTSVDKLRRSSRHINTKSLTQQEMNYSGLMIVPRKNTKTKSQKRKKIVHLKKVKNNNEEDKEEEQNGEDESLMICSGKNQFKTIGIYCRECSQLIDNKCKLKEHLLKVHPKSSFICHAFGCKQRFDKSVLLKKHYKLHDNTTKWTCTSAKCKYTTLHRNHLYSHLSACHLKGRFLCSICPKEYPFQRQVHNHFQKEHKRKTFKCTFGECFFKSSYKKILTEHQLFHTNLKPYECTWKKCGYAFNLRQNAIRHVRSIHFKLPRTLKEMKQRKVKSRRDPNKFVRTNPFNLNAALKGVLRKK